MYILQMREYNLANCAKFPMGGLYAFTDKKKLKISGNMIKPSLYNS